MTRYLICIVLIALTGCATDNRGIVPARTPGHAVSVPDDNTASSVPDHRQAPTVPSAVSAADVTAVSAIPEPPVATDTETVEDTIPEDQDEAAVEDTVAAEDLQLLSGAD